MSGTATIAEVLGNYIATANLAILPPDVIEKSKLCLLDSLACMVSGSSLKPGRHMSALVRNWGGTPESTLVGQGGKVPAPWAAYVNGYLANLLDFDDTIPLGHPGSTVVPTALALSEWNHRSGSQLLAALVVGYEVSVRVAYAVRPAPQRELDVRGVSTWQIFGAAAAASSILGLNAIQAAHAMALTVNHTAVPSMRKGYRDRPISLIKNNLGWANLGGILAAQLAAQSMKGNLTNFEGSNGFWIMAGSDKPDLVTYTEGLGQTYRILEVIFKPYPACWAIHTTLNAVDTLMQRCSIEANQIRRVVIFGAHRLLDYFDAAPQTIADAQWSIPYLTAMLLRRQSPGCAWFTDENMRSNQVAALMRKVEFTHDDEAESLYRNLKIVARVRVELNDDSFLEEVAELARGDPKKPLSAEEVKTKFMSLTVPVLGAHNARQVIGIIEDLEHLDDVAKLTQFLENEEKKEVTIGVTN